jgi:hypothetical protein
VIIGHVTALSPLRVQPAGATSGIPVQRIADTAAPGGWSVGDEVLCDLIAGLLVVIDRIT